MAFSVNISNPYVYLDTLQFKEETSDLWNEALKIVNSIEGLTDENPTIKLEEAITFLEQISSIMRTHEIKFIESQLQTIRQSITEVNEIGLQEIVQKLENLKNFLNQNNNIINTTGFDYRTFSEILNYILSDNNNLQSRLIAMQQNIKANNNNPNARTLSLYTNLGEELTRTFKLFAENNTKGPQANTKALDKLLPFIIKDYVEKKGKTFSSISQFANWLISAEMEFRTFLEQKEGRISKNVTGATLQDRLIKLSELFDEYMQVWEESDNQKNSIIDFDVVKSESTKNDKIKNPIVFKTNEKYSFLKNEYVDSDQIIVKTSLTDANLSEFYSFLPKHLIAAVRTGTFNLGDDALIGYINIIPAKNDTATARRQQAVEQRVQRTLEQMMQSYKNISNARQDDKTFQQVELQETKRQEQILKKLNREIKNMANVFIVHESTKFYTSAEIETYSKKFNGFSGREMAILNYIGEMANIADIFGVNTNTLKFAALNLSNHAVGGPDYGNARLKLEEILSLAASLIMFDSPRLLAREALENMTFSNLTNMHLYNLQGTYYPPSYFVQESINYLKHLESMTLADVMTTTITTPTNIYEDYMKTLREKDNKSKKPTQYVTNFLQQSEDYRWNAIKQFAKSNTKVKIHFFINFQNFIENMKIPYIN